MKPFIISYHLMTLKIVLFCTLLSLIALYDNSVTDTLLASATTFFSNNNNNFTSKGVNSTSSFSLWKSLISMTKPESSTLLKINPSKLISKITKYGGVILPQSIQKDLHIISQVCSCDETSLDLYNQRLEVVNFTISMPLPVNESIEDFPEEEKSRSTHHHQQQLKRHSGSDAMIRDDNYALRIGRFYVTWDSYLKPCLEIEVTDVSIVVEFLNLLLTNHNWNELKKVGFPPTLTYDEYSNKSSTSSDSFFHIGSIDMSGTIQLQIKSRPLNQDIIPQIITFDLDKLDIINQRIQQASQNSLQTIGRLGCTAEDLYQVIQNFFEEKIHYMIRNTTKDWYDCIQKNIQNKMTPGMERATVYSCEPQTVIEARKMLSNVFTGAKDVLQQYAKKVEGKTENDIMETLSKIGLTNKDYETMKEFAKASAKSSFSKDKKSNNQHDAL